MYLSAAAAVPETLVPVLVAPLEAMAAVVAQAPVSVAAEVHWYWLREEAAAVVVITRQLYPAVPEEPEAARQA
jgi:hypothetical protein